MTGLSARRGSSVCVRDCSLRICIQRSARESRPVQNVYKERAVTGLPIGPARLLCHAVVSGSRLASPDSLNCHRTLVDPASSHMLVSKIKPCKSQCKQCQSETANGSLYQLWFLGSWSTELIPRRWTTVAILELIHATEFPAGDGGERSY